MPSTVKRDEQYNDVFLERMIVCDLQHNFMSIDCMQRRIKLMVKYKRTPTDATRLFFIDVIVKSTT